MRSFCDRGCPIHLQDVWYAHAGRTYNICAKCHFSNILVHWCTLWLQVLRWWRSLSSGRWNNGGVNDEMVLSWITLSVSLLCQRLGVSFFGCHLPARPARYWFDKSHKPHNQLWLHRRRETKDQTDSFGCEKIPQALRECIGTSDTRDLVKEQQADVFFWTCLQSSVMNFWDGVAKTANRSWHTPGKYHETRSIWDNYCIIKRKTTNAQLRLKQVKRSYGSSWSSQLQLPSPVDQIAPGLMTGIARNYNEVLQTQME